MHFLFSFLISLNTWAAGPMKADLDPEEIKKGSIRRDTIYLCAEDKEKCSSLSEVERGVAKSISNILYEGEKLAGAYKGEGSLANSQFTDAQIKRNEYVTTKEIELYNNYCASAAYKNSPVFCIPPIEKADKSLKMMSDNCKLQRYHQWHVNGKNPKVKKLIDDLHELEWEQLDGNDCSDLLKRDKISSDSPAEVASPAVDDMDFDPNSCKWADENSRTILTSPACVSDPKKDNWICMGEIVCNRKSNTKLEMYRTATCRSSFCGKGDAVRCVRDGGKATSPLGLKAPKAKSGNETGGEQSAQ